MSDLSDAGPPVPQTAQTAQTVSNLHSSPVRSASNRSVPDSSPVQVTLTLPPELVTALQLANPQLADQSLSQQILTLLLQSIESKQTAQPVIKQATVEQATAAQTIKQTAERSLFQELAQLKQRLSQLEAFLPRLASVEGKVDRLLNAAATPDETTAAPLPLSDPLGSAPLGSEASKSEASRSAASAPNSSQPAASEILDLDGNPGSAMASIWMQIQQSDRPPASIPSTLQPTEPCPKCGQRLMPFKSLGGVRCIGCSWTDKPRERATTTDGNSLDIHRLLEQAAIESEENMKPRKRSRQS